MIFWLFISMAFSFEKDFTIVNQRAPLEFVHLFESLKFSVKDNTDKVRLVSQAEKINELLKLMTREEVLSLIKTEMTKGILEYHISNISAPPITSMNLERIKNHLNSNDTIYTPFSKWIIRSIIADLEPYNKEGILNKYAQSPGGTSSEGLKILKLKRISRYLAPWVNAADSLAPQDFNNLTMKLSWHLIDLILDKTEVIQFSDFSKRTKAEMTFNIPEMKYLYLSKDKKSNSPQIPKTLNQQRDEEKEKAIEKTEKLTIDPYQNTSDLSNAIDQKLDELPEDIGAE